MTSKYSINVFKNLQQYYNRIFNSSNTLPLGRWNLIYDHRSKNVLIEPMKIIVVLVEVCI